jgi:hypothetical protein
MNPLELRCSGFHEVLSSLPHIMPTLISKIKVSMWPSSLIDSTMSPKWKLWKDNELGTFPGSHTSSVEGHVGTPKWD